MEKELDLFKFDESFIGKTIKMRDAVVVIDKCGVRTCWGGRCNSLCKE